MRLICVPSSGVCIPVRPNVFPLHDVRKQNAKEPGRMTVARCCRFLQTPCAMRKAKLYRIGRPRRERMANGE